MTTFGSGTFGSGTFGDPGGGVAVLDALEGLILDGLELNDETTFTLEAATHVPAAKRPEWVSGADSNGALLARDPLYENCAWDIRLRVMQQASMDEAHALIGDIEDKLQECSRNANGLELAWTPAGGSNSITFRCLMGEITERPIDVESGYFVYAPLLAIRLTCLPVGEGEEVLLDTVTSSDPLVTLELEDVAGDVPGLGRLVVTDAAAKARRWVAWGMESRWYPTSSPAALLIDAPTMMSSTGYAGATATRSGAYSGGSNNVISATLRTQVQGVCSLGDLSHVGEFRPQLRFWASATTMAVRLTYQTLDGPFRSLSYVAPVAVGWNYVDLGLVTIRPTAMGTQRWTGRIEAVSTATGGETFQVDYLALVPGGAYGRGRAPLGSEAGVLTAVDDFTGTTAAAALNARVAPVGGTWATSGTGTDLLFTDTPREAVEAMGLSGIRYAILGSTSYTNIEAGMAIRFEDKTAVQYQALIARWVDSSNHLRVYGGPGTTLWVEKVIAGTPTVLASITTPVIDNTWYQLQCVVFASGRGVARLLSEDGGVLAALAFSDTTLETAGTLATGKPGFMASIGVGGSTPSLYFDDFYAATPASEPIAIHSGQSIEFRHDTTLREDSTGVYAGPPPEYVGSRFLIPNSGGPGRKVRVAVAAKRNDVETMPDDYIADSTTVAAFVTPRFLVVPRS